MGVLACARKDCTNIMCDRHSYTYGYICDECFEELAGNPDYLSMIAEFMNTPKPKIPPTKQGRAYLEDIFPISR